MSTVPNFLEPIPSYPEIARLQNSLKHLRETQTLLREFQSQEAPGTADPEVQKALGENEIVM